ncbi:MAG: RNA polymerase factor sigma-54 [Bacteroidales bacterium]
MALKQQLQQRLTQRLSPQQIQVIRLLELTSVELEERIKQEVIDNPALDENSESHEDENDINTTSEQDTDIDQTNDKEDLSLGDYLTEDDIPDYKLAQYDRTTEESRQNDIPFLSSSSIHEHLLQQLGMQELSRQDEKISEYIIGNIDDDGYLRRSLTSISDDLLFQIGIEVKIEHLQELLDMIRDFDPAGVGASNLQECLQLQLEREEHSEIVEIAKKIIEHNFDAFSKKHYDKIQRQLNIDDRQLRESIKIITLLNPKPGNIWNTSFSDTGNHIIPDFIVDNNEGNISFSINNSNIPELKISPEYINMYEDYLGNKKNRTREKHDALLFVKQKLDSAQWFISAIKQRQETLLGTIRAIVTLQKDFFITGDDEDLHPMILKDVATIAGYDISTISRTVNAKYVQTGFGVFPLKYLFSESMQNNSGEEISSREIKKILTELVENENKKHPLSDDILCNMLQEKGYKIARRTVAKYREQTGIAVARLRKKL